MKRLVVLGAGESGVGAAILGKQKNFEVFVSDRGLIVEKYKEVLISNDIAFEEKQHTETKISNADVIVKSPGISETVPLILKLKAQGIKVISEIEFAAKYTESTIIGITGSNGKTTTTLLLHHLLKKGGIDSGVAGNIGKSFAQQVVENSYKNYVLELSSFQLDGIEIFNSHIAIITNITPDHLDRYENDFNKYIASKFRITKNQKSEDYLIYDSDDKNINDWFKNNNTKAQLVPFSIKRELEYGAYIKNNNIIININKEKLNMPLSTLSLKGRHNTKNVMAATMAAQLLKVRKESIKESLANFEGAEHRLENFAKIRGVEYINDSKATNINATFYALECMDKSTVWVVGGVDKGNDYEDLLPLVREKVKAIVCLGTDNEKIKKHLAMLLNLLSKQLAQKKPLK